MTEGMTELEKAHYKESLRLLGESADGIRVLKVIFESAGCLNMITDTNASVYKKTGVQAFALALWGDLHAANPAASVAIFNELMTPINEEINNAYSE